MMHPTAQAGEWRHDMFVQIVYKLGGALISIASYVCMLHLFAIPISDGDLVPAEKGLEPAGNFFRRLIDVENYSGSEIEAVFRNFGITEQDVRHARLETPVHYAASLQSELVIKSRLACIEGAVGKNTLAEVITDGFGRSHVMLYPRFLDSTGPERRANAWHELIHLLTGWSDQQVFMNLAPFELRLTVPGTLDISYWAAKNLDRRHHNRIIEPMPKGRAKNPIRKRRPSRRTPEPVGPVMTYYR